MTVLTRVFPQDGLADWRVLPQKGHDSDADRMVCCQEGRDGSADRNVEGPARNRCPMGAARPRGRPLVLGVWGSEVECERVNVRV